MQEKIKKAKVLLEVLPYIREFYGKTFVIKYGGSAMINPELKEMVAQDLVLLKLVGINVVVVHGGGKHISDVLDKFGFESEFRDGLRVTGDDEIGVVEMVLSGKANKDIVTLINKHGGNAVGISGKDGPFLYASAYRDSKGYDYGHVGTIDSIDTAILQNLEKGSFIPVISPIAGGNDGKTYNVNADIVAGKIAEAIGAEKLIFLTDVQGIFRDFENKKDLISSISKDESIKLMKDGIISGGMLPKVKSIIGSIDAGVKKVHIINGTLEHSLLLEVFTTGGIGTEFHI